MTGPRPVRPGSEVELWREIQEETQCEIYDCYPSPWRLPPVCPRAHGATTPAATSIRNRCWNFKVSSSSLPGEIRMPAKLELYWIYVPGVTVEPYECADG